MDNYTSDEIDGNDSQGCKLMERKFPWLMKFSKIMCTAIGNKSYQLLERFLLLYIQFMTKSIKECSNNLNERIQLRNHMGNTLTFFYFYWKNIKQNYSDHSSYLNKMSQLLGIYLNVELKISKNKRNTSEISAKLLFMLWIYLDESKEHIFRALLRINPILKKYAKICDPIFMKCFTALMTYSETAGDVAYIRYLLIFKIWKSMKKDVEEKKKINEMALAKLGPCIPKIQAKLMKCIPQPPVNCTNKTMWLLQFNVFNIQEACEKLLLFEEGKSRVVSPRDFSIVKTLTDYSDIQTNVAQERTCAKGQLSCPSALYEEKSNLSNNEYNINKNKHLSVSKRRYKFKDSVLGADSEKIILIDLTKEDTGKLQKKMESKRSKRKLEWIQLVRKKSKMQKSVNNVAKIADTRSTDNGPNKFDNTLSQLSPIFHDNVWDNTECLITTDKQEENNSRSSCPTNICDTIHKNDLLDIMKMKSEILKYKICDFCNEYSKQDGTPHIQVAHLMKILKFVIQIFSGEIDDSQLLLNLGRKNRDGDYVSPETSSSESTGSKQSYHNTHCRKEFTEEKIPIVKMCEVCQMQMQGVKHESLIKEDPDESHSMNKNICKDALSQLQSFGNHLQNVPLNINNCQTQVNTVQDLLPNSTKCEHCYQDDNVIALGCQKHTAYYNAENKGCTCDKSKASNTCNAFNECVNVLNRISQLILSICTEKQQADLLKPKSDIYSMLITILGDKVMKSLLADSIHDVNSTLMDKLHKTLDISREDEFLKVWRCGADCCQSSTPDVAVTVKKDCEQQTVALTSDSHSESFKENLLELTNGNSGENFLHNNTKLEYEVKCKCERGSYNKTLLNEEKESQANDGYKFLVTSTQANFPDRMLSHDETKDIDILDSISNGDMNIENEHDILEDTESSLIPSGNNDNSANILNCITNYIKQSEDNDINDEVDPLNMKSDVRVSVKSLPEGSLGATGILNSLLDFDLICMDIASNDFMYSNIQTVNPRVIKKKLGKNFLETNKLDETCTYGCGTKDSSFITRNPEDFLLKKKNESCANQRDVVDVGVDVVGFGLNPSEPDIFDLPSLEDEKSVSGNRNVSSSCGSPLLVNTDIILPELKESSSKYTSISPIHDLSSDVMIEQSDMYIKEDTVKSFQSLNDALNRLPSKTCTSEYVPLNLSKDSLANDIPLSLSHIFVSSEPVQFKELNSSTEDSLNICNSLSVVTANLGSETSNLMTNCKSKSALKTPESLELIKTSCTQCNKKHFPKEKKMTKKSLLPKASNNKFNCAKGIRKDDSKSPGLFQVDQEESSNDYPMVDSSSLYTESIQDINDVPQSTVQFSYEQFTQRDSVNLKQLNVTTQKNKRVLSSMHEGNPSLQVPIFKMDMERERSTCSLQENLLEDSSHSSPLKGRRCFVREMSTNESNLSLTNSVCTGEMADDILMKPKMRWFARSVNTQSPLFFKKQMIKKFSHILFNNEELAMKKRKITSKFLPLSKTDLTSRSKQASNSIINSKYQE